MGLIYPDDWHDAFTELEKYPTSAGVKIVVIGSKNMGKSSLVRFLSKSFLSRGFSQTVSVETDCGQPDNTPPGVISLSLRHLKTSSSQIELNQVISQRYVGFVNPASNPLLYIQTIEKVYEDYLSLNFGGSVPLLVNCHGYGASVGRETWEAIIRIVQPDYVVYVGSTTGDDLESVTSKLFEISDLSSSLLSKEYPFPNFQYLSVSKVIVTDDVPSSSSELKPFTPYQLSAQDYRWVKFADHFRPDLKKTASYRAQHPAEFFVFPYTNAIDIKASDVKFIFPTGNEIKDPLLVVDKMVVGLLDRESKQLICLGFVGGISLDNNSMSVLIPPNIANSAIKSVGYIVKGDTSWSPRDRVCIGPKSTACDKIDRDAPYFLANVLTGDGIGANLASNRQDLKRRRLEGRKSE